jgi:hypothetical protein
MKYFHQINFLNTRTKLYSQLVSIREELNITFYIYFNLEFIYYLGFISVDFIIFITSILLINKIILSQLIAIKFINHLIIINYPLKYLKFDFIFHSG